jgi:PAS domain S-box-containing protein
MKIRYKLLISYLGIFALTSILGYAGVYYFIKNNLIKQIEAELMRSTESIHNTVKSAVNLSIKNQLRIFTEQSYKIALHYHRMSESGLISSASAKVQVERILNSIKVGENGYIFVWDITNAPESIPLAVHPAIKGRDVSYVDFVQQAFKMKNGFLNYKWKNPDEPEDREKSMYFRHFEPWGWIIVATSYKDEFTEIIDTDGIKETIELQKIASSGYVFIINSKGDIIFHPEFSGNILHLKDIEGKEILREMCETKSGKKIYTLETGRDNYLVSKEKLVIYNHIPEVDWIVASTAFTDDIYAPLKNLILIFVPAMAATFTLLILLSIKMSLYLTGPLKAMVERFRTYTEGDFSARMRVDSKDEIGALAEYFNGFMAKLGSYSSSLLEEIDRRKTAERETALFKRFADQSIQGMLILNNDGSFRYANPAFMTITGAQQEDLIINNFINVFYGEKERELLHGSVLPSVIEGSSWIGELSIKNGDNIYVPAIHNLYQIAGDSDDEKLIACVITDITERKKIERIIKNQLEENQAQFEELEAANEELTSAHHDLVELTANLTAEKEKLDTTLRSIDEGVLTVGPGNEILLMNDSAYKILEIEYTFPNTPLNYYETVNIFQDQDTGSYGNYLDPVLKRGTAVILEGAPALHTPSGKIKYLEVACAPLKSGKGEVSGAVIVIKDTTEKRRVEEELARTMKIESLGLFAGGIAHDFNNLLTAIMGNLSLARIKTSDDTELAGILTEAEKASARARDLTYQLLTFSKGGSPIKGIIPVNDLLEESAAFALSGSNIKIELNIQDGLWEINADRGQIGQVFHNIILNARQAMKEGGRVAISAKNIDINRKTGNRLMWEGRYVEISIEDEGEGISPEYIKKIYDPYFTTKPDGTGLGLTISYSIIKRHGGHIELSTSQGRGTTFTIFLPASDSVGSGSKNDIFSDAVLSGSILLMDDEDLVLNVASKMLTKIGFTVDVAKDGKEALILYADAFRKGNPYTAVIMDLTVPGGMGGKEAVKKLHQIDQDAVVIVSSGYSNDSVLADFSGYGFRGAIFKPYRFEDLRDSLKKILL